jgi:hypothetical protein
LSAALEQLSIEEQAMYLASRSYRLQSEGVKIDGGHRIDFKRYPFVMDLLDEDSRTTTILKGGQMGFSIMAVLKSLELAREGGRRSILYYFPSHADTLAFSKSRFAPMMHDNPGVWPIRPGDVDAAELRRIGDTFLLFRGVGQIGKVQSSTSALKSTPADILVLDEVDEMNPQRIDTVLHRLDASLDPQLIELSTPTFPGSHIDASYQKSNQSVWEWRCKSCDGWTCLELTYPDCIVEPLGQAPYYQCQHCHEPLARTKGRWRARRPEITDHRGFWVSQLSSPTRTAADVVEEGQKAADSGRFREFYNHVLAQPYADVDDFIAPKELEACLTQDPRPLRHEGPSAMGVDPGKIHHYEVRVRMNDKDSVQIARGAAHSYAELHDVTRKLNVESGVMDVGFDPTAVMEFVHNHPGWWGCRYTTGSVREPQWNHKERIVTVNREWSLDRVHQDVLTRRVSFYAKDEGWPEYVAQLSNLKRTVVEHPTTGQRKAVWAVIGQKNDHLHHAAGYCALACDRAPLVASVQRQHKKRKTTRRAPRSAMVL